MRSSARPTTRITRSTPKPVSTASSFLVAAPLVNSDASDSEPDCSFSFDSDDQTHSDEDEDAVIETEEVPQWLLERMKGVMYPCARPAPVVREDEETYIAMRSKQIEEEYELAVQRQSEQIKAVVVKVRKSKTSESNSRPSPTSTKSKSKPSLVASSAVLTASAKSNAPVVVDLISDEEEEVLNKVKDMTIDEF